MVPLLLLLFAVDVQEQIVNFYSSCDRKMRKKIYTIVYMHKIPTYNIRSKT